MTYWNWLAVIVTDWVSSVKSSNTFSPRLFRRRGCQLESRQRRVLWTRSGREMRAESCLTSSSSASSSSPSFFSCLGGRAAEFQRGAACRKHSCQLSAESTVRSENKFPSRKLGGSLGIWGAPAATKTISALKSLVLSAAALHYLRRRSYNYPSIIYIHTIYRLHSAVAAYQTHIEAQ